MKNVNLDQLSYDELTRIQKDAESLLKARQKDTLKEAYGQFQQIAKSLGVTVDDIIKTGKSIKNKRPAKYRSLKDSTKTWSGQGRRPRWLEDELKGGKNIDDFLIN